MKLPMYPRACAHTRAQTSHESVKMGRKWTISQFL
nr:MAG TPA: hypothetical protein [Caudoviricetes sp.]